MTISVGRYYISAQCPYDHEDEDEDGYYDESDHYSDEESDNDEPYPEHVPALSFALRPFWDSPFEAAMILKIFEYFLPFYNEDDNCEDSEEAGCPICWERIGDTEQFPRVVVPEMLGSATDCSKAQAERVMAMFDNLLGGEVCFCSIAGGGPFLFGISSELLEDGGWGFTKITRGMKWLAESALQEAQNAPPSEVVPPNCALPKLANTLATSQTSFIDGGESDGTGPIPDLFRLGGTLMPALRRFTR
jgi:hypothetical protein